MKKSKNQKTSKKIKLGDVYSKCNHNKYSEITEVTEEVQLKSTMQNFFKSYGIIIIVMSLICLALFIYAFRNNPVSILYCVGIVIALFIFSLYNSTYKLSITTKEVSLFSNMQKEKIPIENVINIYLSRNKMRFMGFPFYSYLLNIIYVQGDNQMIYSLPTVMLSPKQMIKFFDNIKTVKIKDEEEEQERKEKDKKTVLKTIFYVTFIVLLVVSIIYAIVNGKVGQ